MPQRRVRVFRDERTRSSPLDPKHMLWCVSYHLHAFGTVRLPYETRGKTFRISVKVVRQSRFGFFHDERNNPPHWTLNSCFGAFHTIWVHLGPFSCLTKLGTKRAELVQKFVPRSRIRIFRNEPTRSTPFGCICDHSVALRNSGQNVLN